jgi:hypothetical protein
MANNSEEGQGSQRAVVPVMMMIIRFRSLVTLKMEAKNSSETIVLTRATRCNTSKYIIMTMCQRFILLYGLVLQ